MRQVKKITRATIKSFIRRHIKDLHLRQKTTFDGQVDGCTDCDKKIKSVWTTDQYLDNTLGIAGAWFVGDGRDYFRQIARPGYIGYDISNCCGSFELLIPTS